MATIIYVAVTYDVIA